MNTERWKQIDTLFDAVLDVPESEREAFLTRECGDDDELHNKVRSLLKAASAAGFLENSAIGIAARNLADEKTDRVEVQFTGRVIGTYTIERQIGSGGMGEVYLATDSKLERKIALKVLPTEYNYDDERLKRFELEARAISCLNHPNIVTIYDVGSLDGVNYIATEYIEGKNLRELTGELELHDALDIAIQVCDALAAAHHAGIIHRDIKPENIMVRPDGYVKVLDFGLAKLGTAAPEGSRPLAKTARGIVVGTPAYMSPEQIADENVDYQTDLWSLGVVLFELITGTNPYKNEDRQATFQAILASELPSAVSVNSEISTDLDRVLRNALARDKDFRYRTAAELGGDLRRVKRDHRTSSQLGSGSRAAASRGYFRLTFAALLVAAAASAIWFFYHRAAQSAGGPDWSKATNIQLTDQARTEYFPVLAPDGKSFVYAADHAGNFDIYSQRVGGKSQTNLTADSPANDTQPAFSPDGELIAFRSEREPRGIYVMGATGENLRRVSDFGYHPSWSPDGKEIVVSIVGFDQPTVRVSGTPGLWIVNVETGAKRELSKLDASLPSWSPNGKQVAFWFYPEVGGRRDIGIVPVAGGEAVVITKNFALSNWNPVWSPDGQFLYFVSDRSGNLNFWRVAVDQDSGQVLGQPEPVVSPSKYSRHLNFSRDGKRMIYVQSNIEANIQAVNFDAKALKATGEPFWVTRGDRELAKAELSPDGKQFLARQIRRTQDDIVIFDRETGAWRDVTSDLPFDRYPRWSPDGKQIAFVSDRGGNYEIWICNADGSSLRQVTFVGPSESGTSFPTWSPDGKRLIYSVEGQSYILDLSKGWSEQTPEMIPKPPGGSVFVVWDWSPDGNKVAGSFSQGGLRGAGVYSFESKSFTTLTESGGPFAIPSWLPDSQNIVYSISNKILATDTETKKVTELLSFDHDEARTPFVSRDGRLLYYTVQKSESDIWLLDNSQTK